MGIKIEYKGITINYLDDSKWICDCEHGYFTNDKLSAVKVWIDKKHKKSFKKFKVFYHTWKGFCVGTATSINERGQINATRENGTFDRNVIKWAKKTKENESLYKELQAIEADRVNYNNAVNEKIAKISSLIFRKNTED